MEEIIIKYSKRKTLGLYVTKDAKIELRAPKGTSKITMDNFVKAHEDWINKHYLSAKENLDKRESFQVNYGDELLFLGEKYRLIPKKEKVMGFDGEFFYIYEGFDSQRLLKETVKLYQNLAKEILKKRVKTIGKHMKLKPLTVKVNSAKTRWGSCSGKGNLNFSWYLIMAEKSTIDYVIVHELCHMIEMNHSQNFWNCVAQVLPEYEKEKTKLKELQKILRTQNWEKPLTKYKK